MASRSRAATHQPSQIGRSTAATVPPDTARRCPMPSPAAGWIKPFVRLKCCAARPRTRGHQLAETRKQLGLAQKDIAATLGVSIARISQIEHGEVTSFEVIARYVER